MGVSGRAVSAVVTHLLGHSDILQGGREVGGVVQKSSLAACFPLLFPRCHLAQRPHQVWAEALASGAFYIGTVEGLCSPVSADWGHPALEGRNTLGLLAWLVPPAVPAPTGRARMLGQSRGSTLWCGVLFLSDLLSSGISASLRKSKALLGLLISAVSFGFLPDRHSDGKKHPCHYPCAQRHFPIL